MLLCPCVSRIRQAVFHGGDISYANGLLSGWDFFLQQLVPITSAVPYLTVMGNHEMDWPGIPGEIYPGLQDSAGECGVLSMKLLPMPAPAQLYSPWWSYDIGLVHIVGMETEQNFSRGSAQYAWLEADLASVNRSITPWVVLGGHRPMYVNSDWTEAVPESDGSVMDALIEHVEPLLWKYQVNVAFWGHNHVLQRQAAVFRRKVVQHAEQLEVGPRGARVDSSSDSDLSSGSRPESNFEGGLGEGAAFVHRNPQATVHVVVGTGGAPFTGASASVAGMFA